jgi:hypothetical protein
MNKNGSKVNINDLSTKKVSAVKSGIARRATSP